MTTAQVVIGVATAALIAAVLGEALWLAVTVGVHRVARLPTVAAMAVGAMVAGGVLGAADRRLWSVWDRVAPDALAAFWARHPLVALPAAFVVWDLAGWCYHWIGHRTRVGWASHRVHHTGATYDMTLVGRQSWLPLPALLVFPVVALVGFPLEIVAVCAAVSKLHQALVHTSMPVRTPRWWAATFMTPATHRRHHALDGGGTNLGPVLTLWDRLAGTWDPTPVADDAAYGIEGEHDDRGAVRSELDDWVRLLSRPTGPTRSGTAATPTAPRTTVGATSTSAPPGDRQSGPPGHREAAWTSNGDRSNRQV